MKKLKSEIVRWSKAHPRLLLALLTVPLVAAVALVVKPERPVLDATHPSSAAAIALDYNVSQPLPPSVSLDAARVALGKRLFHDPRLSSDDSISCASCHNLATGGMDNRARSVGVNAGVGTVNAPTVFNSGFNFVQFWDGRAPSLEAQIDGPVEHPKEMASNWPQVVAKLAKDDAYVQDFKVIYAGLPTPERVKDALATFERSLVTPDSRFDRYLRGDIAALSALEQKGYDLFQSYGCASCHQGINLGGNMYEKLGLMGDYFKDRGNVTEADNGRFNVNQDPESMHEFRVPSLRNVALTAPYFHDGYPQTLEQAVSIMAQYQLGRTIPATDLQAVVAFLRTLTGQYQGNALESAP